MLDETLIADTAEGKSRAAGYASPSISARRHRNLDETRRMLREVGRLAVRFE